MLRRYGSSPLAVVLAAACAMGLWTCAYESIGEPTSHAQGAEGGEPTAGEEVASADPSEEAPAAEEEAPPEGPRLRHPPGEGVLGLPIAIEDPDGQAMAAFHAALQRAQAGQGQARILFYGASHVASDSFTGWIREQLQERFGDAGHGFVLPVHPWRSYVHSDVRIESNYRYWDTLRIRDGSVETDLYGLAGVAVETTRAGAWGLVGTAPRGPVGTAVSLFDVYYLKQPGGGDFDVLIDGRFQERVHTRAGAQEAGYATYHVPDGPHTLQVRTRGNGKVRLFGVAMERDRPGVILNTLGINGSRARFHLLWEDSLYREHLARQHPDLVVLAYGTNEAGDRLPIETYEEQLREVVTRIKETAPQASCLLIGPTDRPLLNEDTGEYEDRPRTVEVNETERRVSRDLGCGYFDLLAFMGGPMSMNRWVDHDPPFGRDDHVHLTQPGYQRLAEELNAALMEGYTPPTEGEPLAARSDGTDDTGEN